MTTQKFKAIEEAMKSILDSGSTEKNKYSDCELKITFDDTNGGRWIQFHHLDINRQVMVHEDNPDIIPEGWGIIIRDNDNHFHLINENKVESIELWEN